MSRHALFQLGIHSVAPRKSSTESQTEEHLAATGCAPAPAPFALIPTACPASRRAALRPSPARTRRAPQPRHQPLSAGRPHPPQHPSLAFIHDRSLRHAI